jgi:hydroxymethylpyrimidine/phosphomethylpyrimidine kinase
MSDPAPTKGSPVLILAIGGSDPSGGAGIQADLLTIHANGGHALTVITSVTAQNTLEVASAHHLPGEVVRAQLAAVLDDFAVAAVKTGMLGSEEAVDAIVGGFANRGLPPLVVDPVFVSSTGFSLLSDRGVTALRHRLLPLARICTPNRHEAEILSGISVHTPADAEKAARRIQALGSRGVVIKGGHLEGTMAQDLFLDGDEVRLFPAERITPGGAHGTGCAFASAIATWLGRGVEPMEAVARAKAFVTEAIRRRLRIGHGEPMVNPRGVIQGGPREP